MFGNERMMTTTTTNQQMALTMTSQTTNDDKSTEELTEEPTVVKSVKYQQPSEETISQHRLLVRIDPRSAKTQTSKIQQTISIEHFRFFLLHSILIIIHRFSTSITMSQ